MIKVLFDAHQLGRRQTGNETYVRELLRRLPDQPDLEIVAAVEQGVLAATLPNRVRIRRVPSNGLARLGAMNLLARSERANLVHAIYFAPPLVGRPIVLTIHDISFELYPQFFARRALLRNRVLIRASARAATRVITVSETSRRTIIEVYGLPEERVVAIPNGVGPIFSSTKDWMPFQGDRPLRVLAVGTLEPRKNLSTLLAAVTMLSRDLPIALRVVGPDGFQAQIIRTMATAGRTEVVGWKTEAELVGEYRFADVFVYPSIYEGFGLPVLEAMACGTPVVASTGGSIPEVAGDAALLADPRDANELASAIRRIAETPGLAADLRNRGLARAAEFGWEKSASALSDVYRGIAA